MHGLQNVWKVQEKITIYGLLYYRFYMRWLYYFRP